MFVVTKTDSFGTLARRTGRFFALRARGFTALTLPETGVRRCVARAHLVIARVLQALLPLLRAFLPLVDFRNTSTLRIT